MSVRTTEITFRAAMPARSAATANGVGRIGGRFSVVQLTLGMTTSSCPEACGSAPCSPCPPKLAEASVSRLTAPGE